MTRIANTEEFNRMLADDKAVLFVFFNWSGQAVLSLRLFEAWVEEWRASHPEASVSFYRLDPDDNRDSWTWLNQKSRNETEIDGGFGSVTWLRRGKCIAFVRYAAQAGREELSRLTDEHFGTAKES